MTWRGGREGVSAVMAGAIALVAGLAGAEAAAVGMRISAASAGAEAAGGPGRAAVTSASVPGTLNAVSCPSATSCTTVGSYASSGTMVTLAENWNGSRWTVRATPDPAGGSAFGFNGVSCGTANACLAVGSDQLGGQLTPLAAWWNGEHWVAERVPLPAGASGGSLAAASCASPGSCVAVGSFTTSGGQSAELAESWRGGRLSVMALPRPAGATSSTLTAVSCGPAPAAGCQAVGWDEMPSVPGARALALSWNGSSWSPRAAAGVPGVSAGSFPGGVSCAGALSCTSVGLGITGAGHDRAWAQAWRGGSWTGQSVPQPGRTADGILSGVSCAGPSCAAVGYYSLDGSVFAGFAEDWNGSRWSVRPVPEPAGSRAGTMTGVSCSSADACTAAGTATTSSGVTVTLAERWNGSRWSVQQTPVP